MLRSRRAVAIFIVLLGWSDTGSCALLPSVQSCIPWSFLGKQSALAEAKHVNLQTVSAPPPQMPSPCQALTLDSTPLAAYSHPQTTMDISSAVQTPPVETSEPPSPPDIRLLGELMAPLSSVRIPGVSLGSGGVPQIVVLGGEGSGKSTVINRVTNMNLLPTGRKDNTPRPVYVQFRRSARRKIDLRVNERKTKPVDTQETSHATCAIDVQTLLTQLDREEAHASTNSSTCSKTVTIRVSGPDMPCLDLVDLPSIVTVPHVMAQKTRQILQDHVFTNPNEQLFLAVVKSSEDLSQSVALEIVETFNLHDNTIGVATFSDKLNTPADLRPRVLRTKDHPVQFRNGWVATALAPQDDGSDECAHQILLKPDEASFFRNNGMEDLVRGRRATIPALVERLNGMYTRVRMQRFIPKVISSMEKDLMQCLERDRELGHPIPMRDSASVRDKAVKCATNILEWRDGCKLRAIHHTIVDKGLFSLRNELLQLLSKGEESACQVTKKTFVTALFRDEDLPDWFRTREEINKESERVCKVLVESYAERIRRFLEKPSQVCEVASVGNRVKVYVQVLIKGARAKTFRRGSVHLGMLKDELLSLFELDSALSLQFDSSFPSPNSRDGATTVCFRNVPVLVNHVKEAPARFHGILNTWRLPYKVVRVHIVNKDPFQLSRFPLFVDKVAAEVRDSASIAFREALESVTKQTANFFQPGSSPLASYDAASAADIESCRNQGDEGLSSESQDEGLLQSSPSKTCNYAKKYQQTADESECLSSTSQSSTGSERKDLSELRLDGDTEMSSSSSESSDNSESQGDGDSEMTSASQEDDRSSMAEQSSHLALLPPPRVKRHDTSLACDSDEPAGSHVIRIEYDRETFAGSIFTTFLLASQQFAAKLQAELQSLLARAASSVQDWSENCASVRREGEQHIQDIQKAFGSMADVLLSSADTPEEKGLRARKLRLACKTPTFAKMVLHKVLNASVASK